GLTGWIQNTTDGVVCEVEGAAVQQFLHRLRADAPTLARIDTIETREIAPRAASGFRILDSDVQPDSQAWIQPDLATCPDCLAEILDPDNRRFRYPFTNCTHCGPRFSIVERVPYDRKHTTMRGFPMCAACEAEYQDPSDRRFHAQPIACPACGPGVWLSVATGERIAEHDEALKQSVEAIRHGKIVAVKGIGGFHLFSNLASTDRLRERKRRRSKPFALMYPDLASIERDCELGERERELLPSSAAPIALATKRNDCEIPDSVAPGNPRVGVMLPYSPLHHLLLRGFANPLVATSGNFSEEPICFENETALRELSGIADLFLLHDRPIRRPVDDSVVTVVADQEMVLRRSRGYAPIPVRCEQSKADVLAVGADLKNTVTWLRGGKAFISQHLGDLGTEHSLNAHEHIKRDLPALYPATGEVIAHDLHPDYVSSRASGSGNRVGVQHHHAHIVACMAEHGLSEKVLGVAFDGTGYGLDGTIWGGEFLLAEAGGFERVNWLRPFPLIGGERAVKEPRLTAMGLLHAAGLPPEDATPGEQQLLGRKRRTHPDRRRSPHLSRRHLRGHPARGAPGHQGGGRIRCRSHATAGGTQVQPGGF
ncbi:MAG: carbamoyltransferase HypF, partial [Limisphaerales bacterium]